MAKHSLLLIHAFAVLLSVFGCGRPSSPPANKSTKILVVECDKVGEVVREVEVPVETAAHDQLVAYLNSASIADGSFTVASYVPALLIETETVRINFRKSSVIVSTRAVRDAAWHQVQRGKAQADVKVEGMLRALLDSLPAKDGKS
jgi:hypothetical protein